jgi:hypothetical protein
VVVVVVVVDEEEDAEGLTVNGQKTRLDEVVLVPVFIAMRDACLAIAVEKSVHCLMEIHDVCGRFPCDDPPL